MKKHFFSNLLFLLLILSSVSSAQWSGGISVNLKDEVPKRGVGFIITRNLPFQFPQYGFKVRFEGNYFTQDIDNRVLREKNIFLSLTGTVYFKHIQPYISAGGGYAFLSQNKSALMQGLAGVRFTFIKPLYPFIEFKTTYYFSVMYNRWHPLDDLQYTGAAGLRLEF
jgi:hypothetical protein